MFFWGHGVLVGDQYSTMFQRLVV